MVTSIFRRNFISKKEFQAKFILKFIGMTALLGLAATAVFNVVAGAKLEDLLYSFHMSPRSTGEIILPELVYTTAVVLVLVIGSTYVTLRMIIQGISGPLFRIKKDLSRMAKGDLSFQIILRTKDEFKDVATDFNHMASAMRDRFNQVEKDLAGIRQGVIDFDKYQDRGEAGIRQGEKLLSELEGIRRTLDAFKTS